MKAIATTDFGAPATLMEVPCSEPAEGELLVRVAASSINGFDLSVAKGVLKGRMEHRFPSSSGRTSPAQWRRSAPASTISWWATASSA